MHKVLSIAAALGLLGATPLAAQEPDFDAGRVVEAIDDATLRQVIAAVGASAAPLDDEDNTLRVLYPNGARGVARRMACLAPDECKGLILLGYFARPADVSEAEVQAAARRFGLEQNLASVAINDEGEHVVKAYIIFDGGITLENLAVQVALFGESVRSYQAMLYGPAGEPEG
jgi:pimeloyl-ACP methyl ester carboxylesterase